MTVFVLMRLCLCSHLLHGPAAELCRDLDLFCVFVHSEVEVGVAPLHCYVMPVLIVQEAAQRGQRRRLWS